MALLLHICCFSSLTLHYLASVPFSLVHVPSESPTATLGVSHLVRFGEYRNITVCIWHPRVQTLIAWPRSFSSSTRTFCSLSWSQPTRRSKSTSPFARSLQCKQRTSHDATFSQITSVIDKKKNHHPKKELSAETNRLWPICMSSTSDRVILRS